MLLGNYCNILYFWNCKFNVNLKFQESNVIITEVWQRCDKNFADVNISKTKEDSNFNIEYTTKYDLQKAMVRSHQFLPIFISKLLTFQVDVSLQTSKSRDDKNYENVLFHTTLNMCRLADGLRGNIFMKAFIDLISRRVDFNVKCPFRKTTTLIENVNFKQIFLPISGIRFQIVIKLIGSSKNSTKRQQLCLWKFFGES